MSKEEDEIRHLLATHDTDEDRWWLYKHINRTIIFRATPIVYGMRKSKSKSEPNVWKETVCLQNIYHHSESLPIDHVWVDATTKRMKCLRLHQMYQFTGKVKVYTRSDGTKSFRFIKLKVRQISFE